MGTGGNADMIYVPIIITTIQPLQMSESSTIPFIQTATLGPRLFSIKIRSDFYYIFIGKVRHDGCLPLPPSLPPLLVNLHFNY